MRIRTPFSLVAMTVRWQYLLPFATLALGFLLGRQTFEDRARRARASRVVRGEHSSRAVRRATGTRPEHARLPDESWVGGLSATRGRGVTTARDAAKLPRDPILGERDWDGERFVRWYRAHQATYKMSPRDADELMSFGDEVIATLGRVPRRKILDELLESYAVFYRTVEEAESADRDGRIDPDEREAREIAARNTFADRVFGSLAYSDYIFLTRHWIDEEGFTRRGPPSGSRPRGVAPYANPVRGGDAFVEWYRAYRYELGLPDRNGEFLECFYENFVDALGRIPKPKLMRTLQGYYATYLIDSERPDGHAPSVKKLFRGLRSVLSALDYDRMQWSESWADTLREIGLLKAH